MTLPLLKVCCHTCKKQQPASDHTAAAAACTRHAQPSSLAHSAPSSCTADLIIQAQHLTFLMPLCRCLTSLCCPTVTVVLSRAASCLQVLRKCCCCFGCPQEHLAAATHAAQLQEGTPVAAVLWRCYLVPLCWVLCSAAYWSLPAATSRPRSCC